MGHDETFDGATDLGIEILEAVNAATASTARFLAFSDTDFGRACIICIAYGVQAKLRDWIEKEGLIGGQIGAEVRDSILPKIPHYERVLREAASICGLRGLTTKHSRQSMYERMASDHALRVLQVKYRLLEPVLLDGPSHEEERGAAPSTGEPACASEDREEQGADPRLDHLADVARARIEEALKALAEYERDWISGSEIKADERLPPLMSVRGYFVNLPPEATRTRPNQASYSKACLKTYIAETWTPES